MRVCVTGSSGFIGSALARRLGADGHEVIGLGRHAPLAGSGIPLTEFLQADIAAMTEEVLDSVQPIDAVIHLAGRAHVLGNATIQAVRLKDINVLGSISMAKAAIRAGVQRFVFVSSIGVYGDTLQGDVPVTEPMPVLPREGYERSKWEAEEQLGRVISGSGMELTVVRPALVVGAGAPGNLARLVWLVRRGMPIPLPLVDNHRAFVGLNNLVDLLCRCITDRAAAGDVFVAAEPKGASTRQVIKWIGEGMDRTVRTVRMPAMVLRTGAAMLGRRALYEKLYGDLRVNAAHAREKLGWAPIRPLDEEFRALGRSVLGQ